MAEGVTHISCHHTRIRSRETGENKQTNKLGVYQEQRKVCNTTCMCIPDSRYGLTLAWVTCENSTMLLESDILRLFFTGPYLVSSPLCSVPGVDCPSVDPRQLLLFASLLSSRNCPFSSPATNSHSRVQPPTASPGSRRQLSFASPYHFRVRRDFRSKNPLSGFAPKQTRLLWRPTPIVLHNYILFSHNIFGCFQVTLTQFRIPDYKFKFANVMCSF